MKEQPLEVFSVAPLTKSKRLLWCVSEGYKRNKRLLLGGLVSFLLDGERMMRGASDRDNLGNYTN